MTRISKLDREPPTIQVRRMKTRWGSCSKKGQILLNTDLVQAPIACIDYVIVHELCHLIVPNHSPRFYSLLDQSMPDWRARKLKLEKCAI